MSGGGSSGGGGGSMGGGGGSMGGGSGSKSGGGSSYPSWQETGGDSDDSGLGLDLSWSHLGGLTGK
ncbi:unnamed protein product, partial [Callosobruchus maculatus]